MWNIRRAQFQCHRIANLFGNMYRFGAITGNPGRESIHTIRLQDGLNFMGIERRSPFGNRLLQQKMRFCGIGSQIAGQRRRFA